MIFERPDRVDGPLWVVTSVFNPIRYRSRWRLYMDFRKMVHDAVSSIAGVETISEGEEPDRRVVIRKSR